MASEAPIGVIFDCDGTLLDSMGVWREMESEFAHRAGGELSPIDKDRLTTMTTPEAGEFFHTKFGLGASPQEVVRMVGEYMMEFYSTRATARPGALEFVRSLFERGIRLSVASSSPMPYLLAGLSHTGFLPMLDAVVSVDDVGKPKREPAVYDRARSLMGAELSRTWGVEDALYAIGTLKRAGYHTLAVYDCDLSGTYAELSASAERAVRDFRDLDPDEFIEFARMVAMP